MTKEEMLDYLENKRNLTVGVNNAAVAVNNAEHAREDMKFKYKAIYIGMVVVLPIMAVVTAYAPLFVGPLVVCLWEFAIPVIIVLRITSGRKTKKAIRDARNNLMLNITDRSMLAARKGSHPSSIHIRQSAS